MSSLPKRNFTFSFSPYGHCENHPFCRNFQKQGDVSSHHFNIAILFGDEIIAFTNLKESKWLGGRFFTPKVHSVLQRAYRSQIC